MTVEQAIKEYLTHRNADGRYASFDYCYNYFHSFYRADKLAELASEENVQRSCLEIGFYLASWGMYRGSTYLRKRSVRYYRDLVDCISKMDRDLWTIDANCYCDGNIDLLLRCSADVASAVRGTAKDETPTDTLVTKIMLGVFGNVPAFDSYFTAGMKASNVHPCSNFTKKSLQRMRRFYEENQSDIDTYANQTCTYGFTGEETKTVYTRAKVIDMCGFIWGQKL